MRSSTHFRCLYPCVIGRRMGEEKGCKPKSGRETVETVERGKNLDGSFDFCFE